MINELDDMKKIIILSMAVAISFASCQKSEELTPDVGGSAEVVFTSGISTRATGNLWDEGDNIGVFMYEAGSTAVYANSSNALYAISEGAETSNANFSSDDPLYFIQGSEVDFVAYYPYSESAQEGALSINTADQSTSEKINELDFMVARASGCVEDSAPELQFDRKMSKIVITIARKETMSDAEVSDLYITGLATEGTYTFENASNSVATAASSTTAIFENDDNQIEAIIIPQTISAAKLYLTVDGEDYSTSISGTFTENMQYNYTLSIGVNSVEFTECTITDWDEVESGEMTTTNSAYTASEISESNIPESDIWIITDDGEITSSLMSGVCDAIPSASESGREISIIMLNATEIGTEAFRYCTSLATIELPEATSIGDRAFYYCSSLTTIELPKATSIGDKAFWSCTSLTTLKLTAESEITCGTTPLVNANDPSNITLYISEINSNVTNLTDGTYTFKEIIYN